MTILVLIVLERILLLALHVPPLPLKERFAHVINGSLLPNTGLPDSCISLLTLCAGNTVCKHTNHIFHPLLSVHADKSKCRPAHNACQTPAFWAAGNLAHTTVCAEHHGPSQFPEDAP